MDVEGIKVTDHYHAKTVSKCYKFLPANVEILRMMYTKEKTSKYTTTWVRVTYIDKESVIRSTKLKAGWHLRGKFTY